MTTPSSSYDKIARLLGHHDGPGGHFERSRYAITLQVDEYGGYLASLTVLDSRSHPPTALSGHIHKNPDDALAELAQLLEDAANRG